MKFAIVVLSCVLAAATAQLNNRASAFASFGGQKPFADFRAPLRPTATLKPFSFQPVQPSYRPTAAPAQYKPVASARYNGNDATANIVRYDSDSNPDGSYSYAFETDNGIAAQAQGTPKQFPGNPPLTPDVAQGSFSWTSPEGEVVSITYVADENGYQPQGSALPTPPPIPPQIARALAYLGTGRK